MFINVYLGGGFKTFLSPLLPEETIQIDDDIFQIGWTHRPLNAHLYIYYINDI